MGMSGSYGPADDEQSIATIRHAVDTGVTLIDTGDFYGAGHNELVVGRAIAPLPRDQVVLSVKFGGLRSPDGSFGGVDCRPVSVRNFLTYSLTRLGVDYVDIYRPARLDPTVPIEETIGALGELVDAGYVRHIGLSEVGAATIRRAAAIRPICDVQLEYSLASRSIEPAILPACRELGIAVTAYGVFSRGLIADDVPTSFAPGDWRAHAPRFTAENLPANVSVVAQLRPLAMRAGLSVGQLAMAWVASRGEDIIPLVGTRHASRVDEALAAVAATLDPALLAQAEQVLTPTLISGGRYAPAQLAHLDSEA